MRKDDSPIRLAILEDHQGIIDGYKYRLNRTREIGIEAIAYYGTELEQILKSHPINMLLMDVHVRTAPNNPDPYPVAQKIPEFLKAHPNLKVVVISMDDHGALIRAVLEAGARGYLLKDDRNAINELGAILILIAGGGIYLSRHAHEKLQVCLASTTALTHRQLEALTICAAHPEASTAILARELGVANSTARNILSGAYEKLGVHSRVAAVAEAMKLGLIPRVEIPSVNEARMHE